jgi:HEPN domain-containing protein
MPRAKPTTDPSPGAILNYARQYHEAADALFISKRHLDRPINALYFHTVELALKAYLRAHGRHPARSHKIGNLYSECRALGLKISSDDRVGLENIVSLLESGNRDMGFRYFTRESGSEAELGWTREVVGQLMQVAATFVQPNGPAPGRLARLKFVFGKPVDKTE